MISKLGGMMAPVSNLALTANDTFLLVACADETLRVYSLCLAKELHELRGHEGKVCYNLHQNQNQFWKFF